MTTRTRRTILKFARPLYLRTLDCILPAGSYNIDTDEESIDGLSFLAFRRTATWIRLPAIGMKSSSEQIILVQPAELEDGIRQ